jgi:hypothetical protein
MELVKAKGNRSEEVGQSETMADQARGSMLSSACVQLDYVLCTVGYGVWLYVRLEACDLYDRPKGNQVGRWHQHQPAKCALLRSMSSQMRWNLE